MCQIESNVSSIRCAKRISINSAGEWIRTDYSQLYVHQSGDVKTVLLLTDAKFIPRAIIFLH